MRTNRAWSKPSKQLFFLAAIVFTDRMKEYKAESGAVPLLKGLVPLTKLLDDVPSSINGIRDLYL